MIESWTSSTPATRAAISRVRCRPRNFSRNLTQVSVRLSSPRIWLGIHNHNTMICRNCIQRATALGRRSLIRQIPITRTFSTTLAPRLAAAAAAAAPADAPSEEPPARSSCIPGTVLNGLNYFKGKTDPVALPDNEYPEWLWSCLDVQKKAGGADDAESGHMFCKLPTSLPLAHSLLALGSCLLTLTTASQIQETASHSGQETARRRSKAHSLRRPRGAGAQDSPAASVD